MATILRDGFGQIEPNHLSAQRTAQIYAQLPANEEIEVLENGQYAKYDLVEKEVNFTGVGEWFMVYNEIKLYEGTKEFTKDFALQKKNYTDGEMTPRLLKINIGDIYTTNTLGAPGVGLSVDEGDILTPGADGYLTIAGDDSEMQLLVTKIYTMPDMQDGVKLTRIK